MINLKSPHSFLKALTASWVQFREESVKNWADPLGRWPSLSEELTLEEQPGAFEELTHHQHWFNVGWEKRFLLPAPAAPAVACSGCSASPASTARQQLPGKEEPTATTTAESWAYPVLAGWLSLSSLGTQAGVCETS